MEITLIQWLAFIVATLYLLLLPGANLLRTLDWARKKAYGPVEWIVVSFGLSLALLVAVSLLLALPMSVGLSLFSLLLVETLVVVATTREVVGFAAGLLRRAA